MEASPLRRGTSGSSGGLAEPVAGAVGVSGRVGGAPVAVPQAMQSLIAGQFSRAIDRQIHTNGKLPPPGRHSPETVPSIDRGAKSGSFT